ncbi:MAG: sigma-54-dependent Fis family transcriptional regulator [Deltaproteobacteria bacterium]|nr:sigma-54-dependent Fis family transcriptional regulator [Deltaproteobacteria bacterium]
MERVLVVDDEEGIRTFIGEALTSQHLVVTLAQDGSSGADQLAKRSFHLMITDLKMPGIDGMELLRLAKIEQPEMEVIVLTAHATVDSAIEAMKLGAFDYLKKPLSGPDELRLVVERALERRRLRDDRQRQSGLGREHIKLVARDPSMLTVVEQIGKVAPTNATVLLTGESGTGKEVVARRIHLESQRAEDPFVAVNCAALAEQLLESEMFGHEKGAFTGATARKRGRFELADSGTLFLDEVAELKPELQSKLLRVLEERSFERVGGTRTIEVNIRLIAATNRDLRAQMETGAFREDLYHRLAVFPIHLPALRDRPKDILPLAEHLLNGIGHQLGRSGLSLDAEAQAALRAHSWSGNVRELHNVLERAAILADGTVLKSVHLGLGVAGPREYRRLEGSLKDIEKQAIREALDSVEGHRKKAAARLGIGLRTLYDKIKEYDL